MISYSITSEVFFMPRNKAYSNPLDLNYEYRTYGEAPNPGPICLEAADPVMVVFEDE